MYKWIKSTCCADLRHKLIFVPPKICKVSLYVITFDTLPPELKIFI